MEMAKKMMKMITNQKEKKGKRNILCGISIKNYLSIRIIIFIRPVFLIKFRIGFSDRD